MDEGEDRPRPEAVSLALSALSCPMRAQVLPRQRTVPGQGGGDRFAYKRGVSGALILLTDLPTTGVDELGWSWTRPPSATPASKAIRQPRSDLDGRNLATDQNAAVRLPWLSGLRPGTALATSLREFRVSGWSAPSTRSMSARTCSCKVIASAVRPAFW
jgi:hypothetical protein